ncbi:hypothetical protein HDV06_005240 [Boothiomyces sp. JEL0866]|nr:hypothetical protein HDV06_005240 [Boothiomyces sp. JEL0866]
MSVLLIIHTQKGIMNPTFAKTEILNRISAFAGKARKQGLPVIFLREEETAPGAQFAKNTYDWEFTNELMPDAEDIIIAGEAYDTFHETPLLGYLNKIQCNHIYVCGALSEFCIESSIRRAPTLGFNVTLVGDCHTTEDNGVLSPEMTIKYVNHVNNGYSVVTKGVEYQIVVENAAEVTFMPPAPKLPLE